jgi:large subunit ribosomal protein L15
MSLAKILEGTVPLKKPKRVGRGIGSGKGKTAGRGHKGQKSRSGVAIKGFEGGQMPIYKRLPKRGFNNIFSLKSYIITLGHLQSFIDNKKLDPKKEINLDTLIEAGIIKSSCNSVKILGNGDIKDKLNLVSISFSNSAREKIEKSGGSIS